MKFLYYPDTVLTTADLDTIALDLLAEIPIPEVEVFNSRIIRRMLLQVGADVSTKVRINFHTAEVCRNHHLPGCNTDASNVLTHLFVAVAEIEPRVFILTGTRLCVEKVLSVFVLTDDSEEARLQDVGI